MSGVESERFWDERARENALYFVDNRLDYSDPDDDAFWTGGEEVLERTMSVVGLAPGPDETVLDIGCGVGRMTRALSKRVAHVIGLDVSSEMLARARDANADYDNIEWVHGDGSSLAGIADASVDGCYSFVVFQHLPRAEMTLGYVREMARVLRPGGWALFHVSTDPAVHEQRPPLRDRVKAVVGRAPRGQTNRAWLGSSVDLDELRRTGEDAGLDVEHVEEPGAQFTMVLARRGAR